MQSQRNTQKENTKLRFDKKIIGLSLVLMMLLVTPAQVIHEAGHIVVCAGQGHSFEWGIDLFGAWTTCFGDVDNVAYKGMGGLLTMLVFAIPAALFNTRAWVVIPCLSISTGHLMNAIVEIAFYKEYMAGDAVITGVVMMLSYAVFIGLMIKYGRTPYTCPIQK